jgi:hypothetical protein
MKNSNSNIIPRWMHEWKLMIVWSLLIKNSNQSLNNRDFISLPLSTETVNILFRNSDAVKNYFSMFWLAFVIVLKEGNEWI